MYFCTSLSNKSMHFIVVKNIRRYRCSNKKIILVHGVIQLKLAFWSKAHYIYIYPKDCFTRVLFSCGYTRIWVNIHQITPKRQRSPDMTFIDRSSITGHRPLHTHLGYEFCWLLRTLLWLWNTEQQYKHCSFTFWFCV